MARVLLSAIILFGFTLAGCSSSNQQVAPPKVTATAPFITKDVGKNNKQE